MRYIVHYEETLEIVADSFQEARDRAVAIIHEKSPMTNEENCSTEMFIEDEHGNEEP